MGVVVAFAFGLLFGVIIMLGLHAYFHGPDADVLPQPVSALDQYKRHLAAMTTARNLQAQEERAEMGIYAGFNADAIREERK